MALQAVSRQVHINRKCAITYGKFRSRQKAVICTKESDHETYMAFPTTCVGLCSSLVRASHGQHLRRNNWQPQGAMW